MHLAFAFDINYLTPFYVLITSIFYHNKERPMHLHIIASEVPDAELEQIKAFARKHNAEAFFYDVRKEIEGYVLPVHTRFAEATYYRLFLAKMVPEEVEKFLFIDADAVVVNSLSELYDTDMKHYAFAAVPEAHGRPRPDIFVHARDQYFNAGVFLLNVAEWKKQQVMEKSLDFIQQYPDRLKCVDQDAINSVLQDNYVRLDMRYNVKEDDISWKLAPSQYKEYLKDKVVIHYTGKGKPWMALNVNRLRHLYHFYLKLSPRASEKKYVDFKKDPRFIYRFMRIRMREHALDYPLVRNMFMQTKGYLSGMRSKQQHAAIKK